MTTKLPMSKHATKNYTACNTIYALSNRKIKKLQKKKEKQRKKKRKKRNEMKSN